jgi:SAM-dependent methyltransferase
VETAELPEHVRRNREAWDGWAADYADGGRRAWARDEPTWGVFAVPESVAHLLPDDVNGWDSIELGCGTAYVSAWLARRGARPVGIDNSERQLETARALQREFGIEFPLIHGNAEQVPLPDGSFDLAISEYGAAIWADPYAWIPEAARLLRPGGRLVFLGNSTLAVLCSPDEDDAPITTQLMRPQFGLHRMEWPDEKAVDFHLSPGSWIRLLRANGFEIDDLVELQPAEDATSGYPWAQIEWARQWPIEEAWKAHKVR